MGTTYANWEGQLITPNAPMKNRPSVLSSLTPSGGASRDPSHWSRTTKICSLVLHNTLSNIEMVSDHYFTVKCVKQIISIENGLLTFGSYIWEGHLGTLLTFGKDNWEHLTTLLKTGQISWFGLWKPYKSKTNTIEKILLVIKIFKQMSSMLHKRGVATILAWFQPPGPLPWADRIPDGLRWPRPTHWICGSWRALGCRFRARSAIFGRNMAV